MSRVSVAQRGPDTSLDWTRFPKKTLVANLVSRRTVGFRINNELSSMVPCEIPQACTRTFYELCNASGRVLRGILFRTKFDTGAQTRGVALLGACTT